MAMPRSRRGHHWLIMLMAGDQQAAVDESGQAPGDGEGEGDVPKDAPQLKTVVKIAPRVTQTRRP